MKSKISDALRKVTSFSRGDEPSKDAFVSVQIDRILSSGENGIPAHQYSRLIGDPLRASRPVTRSPHIALLNEYSKLGNRLFESDSFDKTEYCRNARECISYTGHYFSAKRYSEIVDVARDFISAFEGGRPASHVSANGHNLPDDPIEVRKILHSDNFELVHGNHRIASALFRGKTEIVAKVVSTPVSTPLQDMLLDVLWQGNRVELYQPVDAPEVATWPLVRQCVDRAALIDKELGTTEKLSTVDVGCSYGWFVRHLSGQGHDSYGVDRDPFSLKIGTSVYGLDTKRVIRSDIVDWLQCVDRKYDVVSCFSVAHHFALNKASIDCSELFRLLDRVTGKVLFFDTGEAHENWFKHSLSEWTPDYIVNYVKKNTSFSRVVPLGRDLDNRGEFAGNYGRTLFACYR